MTVRAGAIRYRGPALLLLAVALVAAACSTDPDIDDLLADTATTTGSTTPDDEPSSTAGASDESSSTDPPASSSDATEEQSGSTGAVETPTVEPDAAGLPSISEPDPAIVSGVLANGLEYHVRENDNPGGSVEMRLAIDAGSVLEDDDQSGVAHFLEHMVFNGTEDFPERELVDVLRSFGSGFGADINAYTDYDETVYQLTVPSNDDAVGTGLHVLEQFLTSATLAEADVVDERGVVLDEWRGAAASSNGRILDAYTTLYLDGTPYADRAPIGTADAISAMTPDLLRRYYDEWYRPDNAAVIVVGDIDADEVIGVIDERFGGAQARGDAPDARQPDADPVAAARVERLADPDVPEGFVGFALPASTADDAAMPDEAQLQRALYDDMAFEIIGERLSSDARRGAAPFDAARVDTGEFVEALDVPEVSVVADAADLEAAAESLIDEFERVRRYGFTQAEVDRAEAVLRRSAQSAYDGRESRQDRSFADEYVRHFLVDEPVPTAQATFDYFAAVLDRATPENVAYGLVESLGAIAGYSIVVLPATEDADVPSAERFATLVETREDRAVEPRDADGPAADTLIEPPEPVEEISAEPLLDEGATLVDPLLLTFPNGARVSINANQIEEGVVRFSAASPGGLAVVDEARIPDADAAGPVMSRSGLGDVDAVELDQILAGSDVGLSAAVDIFVDQLDGVAATSDLEVLFQLVHLTMTDPRIDPLAVEQYLDDELPYAADPGLNALYAEADAYRRVRYDDPRYLLPTVESLASVDAAGIEEIAVERFGDASDWSFAFSGDLEVDEVVELARTYLGTLPGDGSVEDPGFVEPPPPAGVIQETVEGGTGEQAALAFHFSHRAEPTRQDRIVAAYVGEVVTIRLTEEIREQLGGSYSAFADVQTTGGPEPYADAYVSVTAGVDAVESVSAAVLAELASLAVDGPTEAEYLAAREAIIRQGALFDNGEINSEVLDVLVDPAVDRLEPYLLDELIAASVTSDEVREAIARWMPVNHYIEIRTLPR